MQLPEYLQFVVKSEIICLRWTRSVWPLHVWHIISSSCLPYNMELQNATRAITSKFEQFLDEFIGDVARYSKVLWKKKKTKKTKITKNCKIFVKVTDKLTLFVKNSQTASIPSLSLRIATVVLHSSSGWRARRLVREKMMSIMQARVSRPFGTLNLSRFYIFNSCATCDNSPKIYEFQQLTREKRKRKCRRLNALCNPLDIGEQFARFWAILLVFTSFFCLCFQNI